MERWGWGNNFINCAILLVVDLEPTALCTLNTHTTLVTFTPPTAFFPAEVHDGLGPKFCLAEFNHPRTPPPPIDLSEATGPERVGFPIWAVTFGTINQESKSFLRVCQGNRWVGPLLARF